MSRIILIATIVLCAGMLAGCLLEEDSGTGSESGQSIVGSWLVTDNDSGNHWLLTFYDDGRYIHYTSSTGTDPCVHNEGAEYGTYTYDTSTDILVTTFSFDDNDCHGLSDNDGASIAVIIVNDSMTYNGEVGGFSRIAASE